MTASAESAAILATGSVDTGPLLMGLLGGLALFLFGMERMSEALQKVAGDRLKVVLARLTRNRFLGVLTGAIVTAVIQSSSVTTVLVVGFISAGLLTLTQSVGIIMGANIGSTVTAQIIAFHVTDYALALIAIGFGMSFASRRETLRQYGTLVMGLGLVFFGMGVMGGAMAPLRGDPAFLDWMTRMADPLLGIAAGAVFTAVVQSSAATTGVVIVMAGSGLITLPAGIAIILGANVGTCVTALLASIGKPPEARRAAVVHVLFNVLGVLLWVGFVDRLASVVVSISPGTPELAGSARVAAETPRQLANAHTIFNVVNTLVFVGFAPWFARLALRIVPERREAGPAAAQPRYLDPELIRTPSLALDRVRMEILHQGDRVQAMLGAILPALFTGTRESLERVRAMDEDVDAIHGHIATYLTRINRTELTRRQTDEFMRLLEAANDLENMGDIIEVNLVGLGHRRIAHGFRVSPATEEVIRNFHATISRALDLSLQAVTQRNERAARAVIDMKSEVNRLADSAAVHEARRLVAKEPNRLPAYTVEMDLLENLKRVYYFCKRMARVAGLPGDDDEHPTVAP